MRLYSYGDFTFRRKKFVSTVTQLCPSMRRMCIRSFARKRTKMCFLLSLLRACAYSFDEEYSHVPLLIFHLDLMSVERSRRALKFKTPEEIKNDTIYEIHLFPRKRRPPMKFCAPIGPFASSQLSDADDHVCLCSLRLTGCMRSFRSSRIRTTAATIPTTICKPLRTTNQSTRLARNDRNNER